MAQYAGVSMGENGNGVHNKIKDIAEKNGISETALTNIINFIICELLDIGAGVSINVGDWILTKIDNSNCFYVDKKYTDADMSRFVCDEFTKRHLLKNHDKL